MSPHTHANQPLFSIATDFQQDTEHVAPELAAIAAAGFKAIHWCQNWIDLPVFYSASYIEQTRQLLEHHRLHLADVHGYSGTGRTGIRYTKELFLAVNQNRLEFARILGGKTLVVHLPIHKFASAAEGLQNALEVLSAFEPVCRGQGIRVAVENLFDPVQGDDFLDQVFARFGPDYVGLCYDSGHALMLGRAEYVAKYSQRLIATHLHDNLGKEDWHMLPGKGKADWSLIIGTLKKSGYAGPVTLEVGKPPQAEAVEFCREAYMTIHQKWRKYG